MEQAKVGAFASLKINILWIVLPYSLDQDISYDIVHIKAAMLSETMLCDQTCVCSEQGLTEKKSKIYSVRCVNLKAASG